MDRGDNECGSVSLVNVTMASLTSHTLCREEGSGHTGIIELSPRKTIIEHSCKIIRCWHPLNTLWH